MAGMARHGSVGAFSGFSVCQPALGASLQFLPAIGTPELDDMINTFLPGPASIQDKRAHISMDFFEYSRQTGESFKFYPVPSGSFTPVTESPASSALYDSGYASSINPSPVLSDQGSWTQSPVAVTGTASDARTKSRSSVSKKSSASSSRQQTVDFANHPGMRILTKDGRDVTNSASRGCKTKEQRDHAHLMRIIKACDACRKKKIRCDPSHRKRNASQASTLQAEQKPAKRSRRAEESPPVAVVDAPIEFAEDMFAPETTLVMPSLDLTSSQEFEQFWNEFVTLDQEPVAAAAEPAFDEFLFDSFTEPQSFFSPSSGSSSTSPSQTFTPLTPLRSGASPNTASDLLVDVAGDVSLPDPTVPYLNPGVAHGTNYVDFNLYSPGPEVCDEDLALQMRDVGSLQQSPQPYGLVARNRYSVQIPTTDVREGPNGVTPTAELSGGQRNSVTSSPVDLPWYFDPASTVHVEPECSTHRSSTNRRLMTYRNSLVEDEFVVRCSTTDRLPTNHKRLVDGESPDISGQPSVSSQASAAALYRSRCRDTTSIVVASVPRSSVSPGTPPRPGLIPAPATPNAPSSLDILESPVKSSSPTAAVDQQPLAVVPIAASSSAYSQSRNALGHTAVYSVSCHEQSCASSHNSRSSGGRDEQKLVQQHKVEVSATTVLSTLLTRRIRTGEDETPSAIFFLQLAVFGLVSLLLCATALQAHLASQVNLANILVITIISLARLTAGPSGATTTWVVGSKTLSSPTPSGIVDSIKSMVQSGARSLRDIRSAVSRRAGSFVARLPSVGTTML